MKPIDFDIQKVIEALQGTSESLHSIVEQLYPDVDVMRDFTNADYNEIDNQMFLCEECGWWCEVSQYGKEDGKCEDCSPDND